MARFILFLDRVLNLYLCYIVMACFLSLVPNINFDYPLFHFIFMSAGFYLIPPILGVSFSPLAVMVTIVLLSMGLQKIYAKYYASKETPSIVIISRDEFEQKMKNLNENKDKKDDCD